MDSCIYAVNYTNILLIYLDFSWEQAKAFMGGKIKMPEVAIENVWQNKQVVLYKFEDS